MRLIRTISLAALLGTAACGSGDRQITGKLDLAAFGRTSATLVAVRDDGQVRTVPVRADGRFLVALETGHSHTIAFQDDRGGRKTTFANLVMKSARGRSATFHCSEAGETELGDVVPEREPEAHHGCRGLPDDGSGAGTETPPAGGDTGTDPGTDPGAGTGTDPGTGISFFTSTLVSGSTVSDDLHDDEDHADDALGDRDGDGRPDSVDDDRDDDGICNDDDHHDELEPGDDHGGTVESGDDHGGSSGSDGSGDGSSGGSSGDDGSSSGSGSGGGDDGSGTSTGGDDHSGSGSSGSGDGSGTSTGGDDGSGTSGGDDGASTGRAELPYDVRLNVGDSFALVDAFRAEGPAPASILAIEMEGSTWRLAELQSGVPFTVTQADCDHRGNRDVGRDRIFVAWMNADGTTSLDHLDLRYCGR